VLSVIPVHSTVLCALEVSSLRQGRLVCRGGGLKWLLLVVACEECPMVKVPSLAWPGGWVLPSQGDRVI